MHILILLQPTDGHMGGGGGGGRGEGEGIQTSKEDMQCWRDGAQITILYHCNKRF